MAYNKAYYDERKKELEGDFNKKVANGLQKIFQVTGEIQADLNDIQKKFQTIAQREQQEQDEDKKKEDAKVKPDTK